VTVPIKPEFPCDLHSSDGDIQGTGLSHTLCPKDQWRTRG